MPDTALGFTYPDASGNANLWEHFQALATDINDYLASRGRVATMTPETADSATFTTTVTSIASVTAQLVTGRVYKLRLITHIASTVAGDRVDLAIRENNTAGTELQTLTAAPIDTTTSAGHYFDVEAQFTAVATGSKTFVGTAARQAGTGTLRREAASTRPTLFYVDCVSH